jgi:hypothetical protein
MAAAGHRKQRRLAEGVERECKERSHRRRPQWMAALQQRTQPAALEAHRLQHLAGRCRHQRAQVGHPQRQQEGQRHRRARGLEPVGHLPLPVQRRQGQHHHQHHGAMAQREQQPAPAPAMAVQPCQAVDGGQVVGVQAMARAQHEGQGRQGGKRGWQAVHGAALRSEW